MSLRRDIYTKVKEIVDTNFEVKEINYVPDINNKELTFGNKGLKFEATVLFIDMRDSTKVLNKHNRATVAKIHMAYFHTIIKVANSLGGEVRSFNGDSMLVFFEGSTKLDVSNAVLAAMQMTYMLTNTDYGINLLLKKYSPVNFGIGIDYGEILCTKIGIGGDSNNKDLIWIGNAVNRAVVISDKSKKPNYIGISDLVYNNLMDEVKYKMARFLLVNYKHRLWDSNYYKYNGKSENYYYTSYYWSVE